MAFLSRRRPPRPDARRVDSVGVEPAERPLVEPRPVVADTGLLDARMSGWFQERSLAPGFDFSEVDVVLDLGCGNPPHSAFLGPVVERIILADIDEPTARGAQQRVREAGAAEVEVLVTDSNPIPLPDAGCTRIIATEVLEHVEDPAVVMAELVRVGAPGARYLLSVPHDAGEELQRPLAAPDYFRHPNHIRVFDEDSFEDLVTGAGLEIVHRQLDGFFHTIWWTLFWSCGQPTLGPPHDPLLTSWAETWRLALQSEHGAVVKQQLDRLLPKSQVVVAVKPG